MNGTSYDVIIATFIKTAFIEENVIRISMRLQYNQDYQIVLEILLF